MVGCQARHLPGGKRACRLEQRTSLPATRPLRAGFRQAKLQEDRNLGQSGTEHN